MLIAEHIILLKINSTLIYQVYFIKLLNAHYIKTAFKICSTSIS